MDKTVRDAMLACRVLFSEQCALATARKIDNTIKNIEDLSGAGFDFSKEQVLTLDKTDLSPDALKKKVAAWKFSNSDLPKAVLVDGTGAFLLSKCSAEITGTCNSTPSTHHLSGKVIIITGGAQGFGAGIAASCFEYGANIVIADLNEEHGNAIANDFNAKGSCNKAFFVKTDVSSPDSVENLVTETVGHFGGLDVIVSNAGILRAGGLDEMTPESFELMTKVNYTGYFNCAKFSAEVMKIQSEFSDELFYDIIQINSKSGLKGSNKNFAYAGGKFGGIGLTQSFAMELMPYNVKVNSICPGNFFDGPLWSHPENGLFVQYLNAGKVPGAKSIEDVKEFYEKQVPAGRGCEVKDVFRALCYAVEQEYETGQAIPVTGGQNMLH